MSLECCVLALIQHVFVSMVYCTAYAHIQHLATMAVEGTLNKLSPAESVRRLKSLFSQGNIWKQTVFLVITDTEIAIKDVSTRV